VVRGLGSNKKEKKTLINMLELIMMTLNMVMENLHGKQVVGI